MNNFLGGKMSKRNKNNDKILRKLMLERYSKELQELKLSGKEKYKPKIGRKIKRLTKKLDGVA